MKRNIRRITDIYLLGIVSILVLTSCSINKMATSMVADALASPGGTSVFASEEDPQLVADALPFALKLYETLLQSDPDNRGLLEAAAEGFVSYANAFIHTPATMLGYDQLDQQKEMLARARAMYLRGRDYALRSLEVRHPGFTGNLDIDTGRRQLEEMDSKDVKALYWAAAGWMGAVSAAGFDTALLMELPRPVALAAAGLAVDEAYGQGAFHSLFIDIYGGIPSEQMLYGSSELGAYSREILQAVYEKARKSLKDAGERSVEEGAQPAEVDFTTSTGRARFHFNRAIEISEGHLAGPYVSLAASVVVQMQDADEYRRVLEKALAIDIDAYPGNRLVNVIMQRKAEWMLETIEDRFLVF